MSMVMVKLMLKMFLKLNLPSFKKVVILIKTEKLLNVNYSNVLLLKKIFLEYKIIVDMFIVGIMKIKVVNVKVLNLVLNYILKLGNLLMPIMVIVILKSLMLMITCLMNT